MCLASSKVGKENWRRAPSLRWEKKFSTGALSQQLPRRDMEGRIASISAGNPDYIAIPYWSIVDQNSLAYLDKNSVEIWDIKTGDLIRTIAEVGAVGTPLSISPNGKFLAVTQSTSNQIWEVSSGKAVSILRHTLRDRFSAILRETSSPHKVFFPQGRDEVGHSCRSFPMPSTSH
jgi:WD40 repeat protein